MKKKLFATALIAVLFSCQEKKTSEIDVQPTEETVTTTTEVDPGVATPTTATKFDFNKVAVTDKFTGTFPYVVLPTGYAFTNPNQYSGKGVVKDVDREYFYNDGFYFPVDGKSYKAGIRVDENATEKTFSKLEIQKSLDKFIANAGGVIINNGKPIAKGEKDRLDAETPNAYSDGYLHSAHNYDDVHTYVVRTKEKVVLIQYNLGSESANITVMEMDPAE